MADLAPEALVILLHGVGSNGEDMMQLASYWQHALPNVAFTAPNAPFAAQFGEGFQWFSIAGVTKDNRPGRIAEVRAEFDALIQNQLAAYGFAQRLNRVILVGFSQGAMMTLDAVASGRWPVAGAVAFSGRLASILPLHPAASKLLLIHGDADTVVPAAESLVAAKTLRALGVEVETMIYPGLGHTISPQGARLALDFMSRIFA